MPLAWSFSTAHSTTEDSFLRHDAYFFKDGNITFLVREMLYGAQPTDPDKRYRHAVLRSLI